VCVCVHGGMHVCTYICVNVFVHIIMYVCVHEYVCAFPLEYVGVKQLDCVL